jgi:hypothetical protein
VSLRTTPVFGLRLALTEPLPGLPPDNPSPSGDCAPPDLRVHPRAQPATLAELDFEALPRYTSSFLDASGQPVLRVHATTDDSWRRLDWSDGNRFWLPADAREVWADWPPFIAPWVVADRLLGPVMALVLRRRGRLPLHASAVVVDDAAVAFVGAEGSGKSTTAAKLVAAGLPGLTDDLLALSVTDSAGPIAHPGPPWLRLRPDGATALREHSGARLSLAAAPDGHHVDLKLGIAGGDKGRGPLPLAAVILLDQRRAGPAAVTRQSPSDALMQLLPRVWATRLLAPAERVAELALLADLVERVAVYNGAGALTPAVLTGLRHPKQAEEAR